MTDNERLGNENESDWQRCLRQSTRIAELEAELVAVNDRLREIDEATKADADDLEKMRDGTKLTRTGLVSIIVYQRQDIDELKERLREAREALQTRDMLAIDMLDVAGEVAMKDGSAWLQLPTYFNNVRTQLAARDEKLTAMAGVLKEAVEQLGGFFDVVYGANLDVVGWHKNGDSEPLNNFIDENIDSDLLAKLTAALAAAE
jgi:hypothetical protein